MAELFIRPLVPQPIVVSTIKITSQPEVGWVLTSDKDGNGTWQSTGEPGPASALIAPVTIFNGVQNSVLTMNNETDPEILPVNLLNGQLLIGSTGAAPVASTLTAGLGGNINITNSPGHITVGTVTNPSFGATRVTSLTSTGVVQAGSLNSSTITSGTGNVSTVNSDLVNTAALRISGSPTNQYILQCDGSGLGTWQPPRNASSLSAGPSGNLIITPTGTTTTQIETKSSPTYTSLVLRSTPNNITIACPTLGQTTNLILDDPKSVNSALLQSTRLRVSQVGSITSGVTINAPSGIITSVGDAKIYPNTSTVFTVTNNCVTASSVVLITCTQPGFSSSGGWITSVSNVVDGSFQINIQAVNTSTFITTTFKFSFLIC